MTTSLKRFSIAAIPWLVLLHAIAFLAFWLTNASFYADTNNFLVERIGAGIDYVSLCLLGSGALVAWSANRIACARRGVTYWRELGGWLYMVVSLVYVVFFYGSFTVLFQQAPVQKARLVQLVGYHGLILDAAWLVGGITLAAGWLRRRGLRRRGVAALVGVYALAWALALAFPPGGVYHGELPTRPRLVAHRGASMLAPENTLAAARRAVELGAYGLETDIRVSRDGGLFLMHDDTLERTTDVAAVFSGRDEARAESFSMAELGQLNAGEWFAREDPYGTVRRGEVTAAQAESYGEQRVPTLEEALEIVRESGVAFIFDLKQPPEDHPYQIQFFELAFEQIHQAGIDAQVWFLASEEQAAFVQTNAPEMKLAAGVDYEHPPAAGELAAQGYQVANAEYALSGEWIRDYQEAGLWVNLYTVDEPWQYSRLWLLGVDSVTTNDLRAMSDLERPRLGLSYAAYLALWAGIGVIGLGGMLPAVRALRE